VGRDLIERLPDESHAELDVTNDSKVIFLHVVTLLRGGADAVQALAGAASMVADLARKRDQSAALTMCLVTSGRVVAARTSVGTDHNTLFSSAGDLGRWIASEPLDTSTPWVAVPEDHLVDCRPEATELIGLEEVV
jgi:predicted glutamine amidotransferase